MTRHHRFYQGRALDRQLRALFEEGGKLPDMTRVEHEYHRRTTRFLIILVAFFAILSAASWLGFFLFGPKDGGGEVELAFEGPSLVVAGVPQQVVVSYKNKDRDPLAFGALLLRPSRNLLIKKADPEPTEKERLEWKFGTLPAKHRGKIALTVIPYGLPDETFELQALFTFKPSNFNAEFQTSKTHPLTVRASAVRASLEGPTETVPGQELAFVAHFTNETDEIFEDVRASLQLPEKFTMTSTDPKAEGAEWNIGTLPPGQQRTVSFKGNFLSGAHGAQDIQFTIEVAQNPDTRYHIGRAAQAVSVRDIPLFVELFINENPTAPQWVRLGETLTARGRMTNNGTAPLANVRFEIHGSGPLIDWQKAQAQGGRIEEGLAAFPQDGALTLEPGQSAEFIATLPLRAQPLPAASPFVELSAQGIHEGAPLSTPPVKLTVVSDLKLTSEVRYFDDHGSALGSGPLPPQVGQETRFEVRLRLRNTFHDLSNIVVIAPLPEGVRWTGKTSAGVGSITFREASREVRLEIPRLLATTPEVEAQFEVGATPKESDQGQLLLLLGVSRAEALDTIAQVTFSADAPSLSSLLEHDQSGKGKGVVQ